MKLKNIAIASALVAGNLFAISANAQSSNLITSFNATATTPSGTSVANGGGTYSSGVLTSTTTTLIGGIPTNATASGYSNNFSMVNGHSYTFSYSSSVAMTSGLISIYNPANTSAAGFSVMNSVSGYSSPKIFTFTNASGTYALWINLNKASQFTVSSISLIDNDGSSVGLVDLSPNAYALRSVYNVQTAALNAGLSYDCNVFDKEGFCLSTGGRYSVATSPETKTTSGLLIGSYKYDKNIRLGAWVDQNLSTQNTGGINLSNSSPLFGVFGAWTERNDGLGYEVKVSAGYGDKDADVTRTSTNVGAAQLHMRGISTVSSYGLPVEGGLIAAPYVGVKYTSISRSSYTEAGSGGLTYDNLNQESTTAVAGAKLSGKIDAETSFVVSAGVEHDVNHHIGQYSAGSSNSVAFNPVIQKTRPVVSAGVYYDIDKTQRLGLNATVKQEAFQSTSSTTALATYTVGF